MKRETIAVTCLALFLVTGVNAARARRCYIRAPVSRFLNFYIAAEKSEMTVAERIFV